MLLGAEPGGPVIPGSSLPHPQILDQFCADHRGFMSPVFGDGTARSSQELVQRADVIGTQPGKYRHVVCPAHHIDRVDLQLRNAIDGVDDFPCGDGLFFPALGQALGGQRDSSSLFEA